MEREELRDSIAEDIADNFGVGNYSSGEWHSLDFIESEIKRVKKITGWSCSFGGGEDMLIYYSWAYIGHDWAIPSVEDIIEDYELENEDPAHISKIIQEAESRVEEVLAQVF